MYLMKLADQQLPDPLATENMKYWGLYQVLQIPPPNIHTAKLIETHAPTLMYTHHHRRVVLKTKTVSLSGFPPPAGNMKTH